MYVWHCDREGRYSMYSEGIADENYLRGVQVAGDDGRLTFTSIFPGAYSGRWPHIHFEVYPDEAEATSAGTPTATSQIALPEDVCAEVYATDGYDAERDEPVPHLARVRQRVQRRRGRRPDGDDVGLPRQRADRDV